MKWVGSWRDVSISKKLYFVVGIMAFLIVGELVILRFAMHTLSAARAFVGGEGLWSKAQKNAAISLQRYGRTENEADFRSFVGYMQVPEGDHAARIELFKPSPTLSIVREGFLRGRIDPDDIDPMIDLLRRFYWTSYLSRAIAIWTDADDLLAEFKTAGLAYHAAVVAGDQGTASTRMAEIKHLNESLTVLEDAFSYILGAGSRWIEHVVLTLLSIAVLAVESIGLTLTFLTSRSISRGLKELNETAMQIGRGDLSATVRSESRDELGQLGRSVNQMGEMLRRSYADLERRVNERTRELASSRDQLDAVLGAVKLLDEASQILASSMIYTETLRRVAALVVPRLADWCAIDLPGVDGHEPLTIIHAGQKVPALVEELRKRDPVEGHGWLGSRRVLRSGKAELDGEVEDQPSATAAPGAPDRAALRQLGIESLMIVPVPARSGVHGALTFVSADPGRRFVRTDLRFAEELARRAGIAIENARLYEMAQGAVRDREDFLSIVSHELNTPLTSLKLQIQMARQKVDRAERLDWPRDAIARALSISENQITRLSRLVEDLLDVARIKAGRLTFAFDRLNLSDTVQGVVGRFADQLNETGNLVTTQIEEDIVGLFDQTRIEQLVDNLLTNAMKHASGKPVKVSLGSANQIATLVVEDQGPGIAEDKQPTIFERFERGGSERSVDGLGLGLFIAKEIAGGQGGSIRVQSRLGEGARFIVELPLSERRQDQQRRA
jgi:signal transduction histidine kinase/HAMP domain-containing protein